MTDKGKLVHKEIYLDELCLRCVFHPIHIDAKGKLKREALLPPPNKERNDVSLLRLNYMSIEECIEHGEKTNMGSSQFFIAIASITRQDVLDNNKWAETRDAEGWTNGTSADIFYAPMSGGDYVDLSIDVYSKDASIDLPAHADLRYDTNLNGTVQTRMRQYSSKLVKRMRVIYNLR